MSKKSVYLSGDVIDELDKRRLAISAVASYDAAVRVLLGLPPAAPAGRPEGVSKWPFETMDLGDVYFDAPPGAEFRPFDAMRRAVYAAEEGTGKRFVVHRTRKAGKVWVTRVK